MRPVKLDKRYIETEKSKPVLLARERLNIEKERQIDFLRNAFTMGEE